ncbi:hypothetical protein MPL3356_60017 [Mesorhizobium plurifarium]|uniref:Aminotransferase class I/classII large domain-containing protein n=1 Tax=Mesorhizobium plurifarium TaxID=69974 RepID=A0A090ECZ3_MESPL|nr:hypothetical protein MPL3356_60017 [Mesorhizobium plurifarium]
MLERYQTSLSGLARRNRLRELSGPDGIDYASNDYLGLARSKRMADAVALALAAGTPVGATGSRLLRGNDLEHEALEAKTAHFFGAERALFFGGGYVASSAVLTTLPQKGDLIVLDELVHASAHEGARAGRSEVVQAAHKRRGRGGRCHPGVARTRRRRACLDRGREPLLDGRRSGTARQPDRGRRPPRGISVRGRGACHRHLRPTGARPRPRAREPGQCDCAAYLRQGPGRLRRAGDRTGSHPRLPRQPLPALHLCDGPVAADGGGGIRGA